MKTEKRILIAFFLNLAFSIFELFGGIFTGSVAILSDSVHDMGDALGIGISYALEKKSKKHPDEIYTYGYRRFSLLGSLVITSALIASSFIVFINALKRIFNPVEINYNGMIIFAVVGIVVNSVGAVITSGGESLNKKAVNLHLMEDVFGWVAVLVGAVIMRFTDFSVIDPLLSAGISVFITVNAISVIKETAEVFLEKCPDGVSAEKIRSELCQISGVNDVHHIHIRSIDGNNLFFTAHIETEKYSPETKKEIKQILKNSGITHVTLEFEESGEECSERECSLHEEKHGTMCCHGHHAH